MNFDSIQVTLELLTKGFTNALSGVRSQVQKFSSDLAEASDNGATDKLLKGYVSLEQQLRKVGLSLRDIARISAGIVVSQTFYAAARTVREATQALWEFNEALDYAQITYGALFNSTDVASDFIETLKKFSVETIFEYTDIEQMARTLSAYGIEYKNLMFIIEGLTNIGTITGDSASLNRLAVAIGQINAKGKLMAEELRQLANASTPVYDILRERLGLSDEQLDNVGDAGIKAADAINAIIEYANDKFGSTADAAVYTITGVNNRIVDSLKVLGSGMLEPATVFYKSFAKYIADGLVELQAIYEQSGVAGMFEKLVPDPSLQERIRQFLAAISNSLRLIVVAVGSAWPFIKQILGSAMDAMTTALSVANAVGSGLVAVIKNIAANTPAIDILTKALTIAAAAWVLFRIQALATAAVGALKAIIAGVAGAVVMLSKALTASPLLTGLILLGAVFIGLSANANNANSAISNLINKLNSYSLGGKTSKDVLQVEEAIDSATDSSSQFWESMTDGADDAGDAADEASKKAKKSLLSFDEVFRLQDNDTSTSLSGIEDLVGAFEGLGEALIPEVPDLSSFADDFVNTLYNDLWDSLKTIATGAATGALIGGLIGFTIGGLVTRTMAGALTGAKWGARIGAIAGGAFAGFWTDAYKELENALIKIAVGTASGALIGGLVGMVIGAFATRTMDGALTAAKWGATIGGLIGGGVGVFWAAATEEMDSAIKGLVIGGATGALVGGLAGMVIGAFATKTLDGALHGAQWGAAIGGLLGGTFTGFWAQAEEEMQSAIEKIAIGTSAGALVGGLVGLVIGAFATKSLSGALLGAKWGAAIGGLLGGAFTGFWSQASEELKQNIENLMAGSATGALIGGLSGLILGAFATKTLVGAMTGAKLGAAIGGVLGGIFTGFWGSATTELRTNIENLLVGSAEGALMGGIVGMLIGAFATKTIAGAMTGAKYGAGIGSIYEGTMSTVFGRMEGTLSEKLMGMFSTVSAVSKGTLIGGLIGLVIGAVVGAFAGGIGALPGAKMGAQLGSAAGGLIGALAAGLKSQDWAKSTASWWNGLWDTSKWKSGWAGVKQWFSDFFGGIRDWFVDLGGKISSWWDGLWSDKSVSVDATTTTGGKSSVKLGHATGGIFNREHIARFAEGNKAEAVIPLENASAMQPFVDAIANGITATLAPMMATSGGYSDTPPVYVGTLIADDKGLKELERKLKIIRVSEERRGN